MKRNNRKSTTILVLLCAFLAALFLTPLAVGAEEAVAEDKIFSAELEIGGKWADTSGDRTYTFPYDPMDSSVIGGFDLFSITPRTGSFSLASEFMNEDDWDVRGDYSRGADVRVGARARKFYHALEDRGLPPDFETPAPGFDSVHVESRNMDPDSRKFNTLTDYTAYFRARMPTYPAHVSASARHYKREGTSNMVYFFRTCSTHVCHVNSKPREIDQETMEYNIGLDTHLGPVDFVYNYNHLGFQDKADDPVDFYGDFNIGPRTPGDYTHHVNPETQSYTNTFKVNSNLTNRMVLSLDYRFGKSKNDDSNITEDQQHFVADLSYRVNRQHFLSLRYLYDDESTGEISEESRALREAIGDATEPGRRENMAELTYLWTPTSRVQMHAHGRYGKYDREDTVESGLPEETKVGSVDVDVHYLVSPALDLEGELAWDWQENPAFATDFTRRWRYMIGAVWGITPDFNLQAFWRGYRGENDDEESLSLAYDDPATPPENLKRDISGDVLQAVAHWTPAKTWRLLLSYAYTMNGVDQDMILGTASYPDRIYRVEDVPWDARTQVGNLEIEWAATRRLTCTLGGLATTGKETLEPEFALSDGLAEAADSEYLKLMGSLEFDYAFSKSLGVTLAGYWADYDDRKNDLNDGDGASVAASIRKSW